LCVGILSFVYNNPLQTLYAKPRLSLELTSYFLFDILRPTMGARCLTLLKCLTPNIFSFWNKHAAMSSAKHKPLERHCGEERQRGAEDAGLRLRQRFLCVGILSFVYNNPLKTLYAKPRLSLELTSYFLFDILRPTRTSAKQLY
jgi:hypothetical protein